MYRETNGNFNIVDFVNEFSDNNKLTCRLLDVIIYKAPETRWSTRYNRYVKTGKKIDRASAIVKLLDDNYDNEYLIYCPLSKVEELKTLKGKNLTCNNMINPNKTNITFATFTNNSGKEIGYIKEIN